MRWFALVPNQGNEKVTFRLAFSQHSPVGIDIKETIQTAESLLLHPVNSLRGMTCATFLD